MFRNRQHAGLLLARQVVRAIDQEKRFDRNQIVVVGLPRGGVTVALEIALALGSRLDVLMSKKIGAPNQAELAIGAVTVDGLVVLNNELIAVLGVGSSYTQSQTAFLMARTKALEEHLLNSAAIKDRPSLRDKQVIIVDDGIATGMTAVAAARSARQQGAQEIILATPVISCQAYTLLKKDCDQIIALNVLSEFAAIGQFYLDFNQVEDKEVIKALRRAREERLAKQDVAVS